jgi:hypothetical protein
MGVSPTWQGKVRVPVLGLEPDLLRSAAAVRTYSILVRIANISFISFRMVRLRVDPTCRAGDRKATGVRTRTGSVAQTNRGKALPSRN